MNRKEAHLKSILAVASGGGHLEELLLLSPSFGDANVLWVTTNPAQAAIGENRRIVKIDDYNQNQPLKMLRGMADTFRVVFKARPNIVITTGAAPGLLCLVWGKVLGARTIWLDSIANAEELSLSGRLACFFADDVITQWEHLAVKDRPEYLGSLL